jgi:serine/tyrosine/threonine adenylyltransferase
LQLKGPGPTPFSRRADGRAVLRSSVREFLCSEAMFHLQIPTTRALSLVLTGDDVLRDMFYDGHAAMEPGAIVCRVAPSFIRFGNFELCASRDELLQLRQLADFTLRHFYPHLGAPSPETYRQLFIEVSNRTAQLMAHWQRVGFVHGVMNTDNMSILGLSIDYGPYGWVDNFDPSWTPNTTDAQMSRYAYGNQPQIGLWNVSRLGLALSPLFETNEHFLEEVLEQYELTFERAMNAHFAAKFGLMNTPATQEVIHQAFEWMAREETDFTLFFRALAKVATLEQIDVLPQAFKDIFYAPPSPQHEASALEWMKRWQQVLKDNPLPRDHIAAQMNAVNPYFVLRNYLAQEAIDAAHEGDFTKVDHLLAAARHPFDEAAVPAAFAQKRPEWARHKAGCSALSCSS